MKKYSYCLLLVVSFCFCFHARHARAAELELKGPHFYGPNTLAFTVNAHVTTDTDAFGFDIQYPATMLRFRRHERGALLEKGFSHILARVVSPGLLRIGGMDIGGYKIPNGAEGTLFTLLFEFLDGSECDGSVYPTGLKDDISELSTGENPFDLNADLASLIQMLKILAGHEIEPPPCLADINGDDRIGLEEAIHLLVRLTVTDTRSSFRR
ncbi:MAG: cohesin domain-containing protein [Desulfococcaceae bacterium]